MFLKGYDFLKKIAIMSFLVADRCILFALVSIYILILPSSLSESVSARNFGRTLTVGDGDFSFSRSLMKLKLTSHLIASTLDSQLILEKSFPVATSNTAEIRRDGGQVMYEVDATNISGLGLFDSIIWNFPHVAGKQNIKYNRELLSNFFNCAKLSLTPDGAIYISLCGGQSGTNALTLENWNRSWKLTHHAATAGLILVDSYPFQLGNFPGYSPAGHRGHGGAFALGVPEVYVLATPTNGDSNRHYNPQCAVQAPMYAHEVHVQATDFAAEDICGLQSRAQIAAGNICRRHSWNHALWSVSLVDVYDCPSTKNLYYAIQLAYCSRTSCVDRTMADEMRSTMESELPAALHMRPRLVKHGGRVSAPYPWYIATRLQEIGENLVGDSVENSMNKEEAGYLHSHLRFLEDGIRDVCMSTDAPAPSVDKREKMRAVARSLWGKRVGVLIKT